MNNNAKTTLYLTLLTIFLLLIGELVGGAQGLILMLTFSLILNFGNSISNLFLPSYYTDISFTA